ncbi:hypothetical protein Taro_056391 [Colocasia esculenta]|uniref:Uncharacterized protein n=1 Tax=Colocasia esculenta TaxID=4460 RepID=A0A843XX75_COLES|nr:hypothetical protein [Colocasia esculenta]
MSRAELKSVRPRFKLLHHLIIINTELGVLLDDHHEEFTSGFVSTSQNSSPSILFTILCVWLWFERPLCLIPAWVVVLIACLHKTTYMFTRPEDLPRARAIWESTAQNNFRKSMWEAWDKAAKITDSQDPTTWMDYSPVWMRRDYWESLCHRWATGPWQERSQAAKRNRAAHPEKNVHTSGSRHELERAPTFCELFDRTHKRKGTDDYVSESARTIAETYDRTMANLYVEGTPQPDLDPKARVDAAGGLSVRLWGQPGYYSSVVLICEFSRSSGLREFICCDARQWWRQHQNPHPGRAVVVGAAAPWRHGRAAGGCYPRSRPLTASPSGQYYY